MKYTIFHILLSNFRLESFSLLFDYCKTFSKSIMCTLFTFQFLKFTL